MSWYVLVRPGASWYLRLHFHSYILFMAGVLSNTKEVVVVVVEEEGEEEVKQKNNDEEKKIGQ